MSVASSALICALHLLDRAGREAEIDRAAGLVAEPRPLVGIALAGALEVVESPAQDDGQLVDIGRLERGQPVLGDADQRRADRLVGAALRRQRNAGRGRHQHEAGVLVAGIVERVGAAIDERDRRACRWGAAARPRSNGRAPAPTAGGRGCSRRCRARNAGRPATAPRHRWTAPAPCGTCRRWCPWRTGRAG